MIGLLIAGSIVTDSGIYRAILCWHPLRWLGRISYSVYVWQQLFLMRPHDAYPLGRLSTFPINLLCVLAVGWISFALIERPIVRFAHRRYPTNGYAPPPLEAGAAIIIVNA
jgi:peptidoglycan/LPS O-acetylase OafA/YrhL